MNPGHTLWNCGTRYVTYAYMRTRSLELTPHAFTQSHALQIACRRTCSTATLITTVGNERHGDIYRLCLLSKILKAMHVRGVVCRWEDEAWPHALNSRRRFVSHTHTRTFITSSLSCTRCHTQTHTHTCTYPQYKFTELYTLSHTNTHTHIYMHILTLQVH